MTLIETVEAKKWLAFTRRGGTSKGYTEFEKRGYQKRCILCVCGGGQKCYIAKLGGKILRFSPFEYFLLMNPPPLPLSNWKLPNHHTP